MAAIKSSTGKPGFRVGVQSGIAIDDVAVVSDVQDNNVIPQAQAQGTNDARPQTRTHIRSRVSTSCATYFNLFLILAVQIKIQPQCHVAGRNVSKPFRKRRLALSRGIILSSHGYGFSQNESTASTQSGDNLVARSDESPQDTTPVWEVRRIVDSYNSIGYSVMYKMDWESTWESAGNLDICAYAIREFHRRRTPPSRT